MTVTFQCGNCNKLMAVGADYLGQQVRCPHCQAVVIAPVSQATPPPAPLVPSTLESMLPVPASTALEDRLRRTTEDSEDIFNPSTELDDALFGGPVAPKFELPPPSQPIEILAEPKPQAEPIPAFDPSDDLLGAVEVVPAQPPLILGGELVAPPPEPMPRTPVSNTGGLPWLNQPVYDSAPSSPALTPWLPSQQSESSPVPGSTPWKDEPTPSEENRATDERRKPRAREVRKLGLFIPLVFVPVLIWAVAATAAAAWGWYEVVKAKDEQSPFDRYPDVEGDLPGVQKSSAKRIPWGRENSLAAFPKRLRVKLGETLALGDLEVTPRSVKIDTVQIAATGSEELAPCLYKSLVLTLRLKNRGGDYAFAPLDAFFDRKPTGQADDVPRTVLSAGTATFFGGSAEWRPLTGNPKTQRPREWVERPGAGPRGVFKRLAPGEEIETTVATNGYNPLVQEKLLGLTKDNEAKGAKYAGSLLWRVQVRRGLVSHNGKERSATAVIGVELTETDYAEAN